METLLHAGLSNALSATFLALLVACLGRVLARRPAILHCLWLLVLVKLVTPPLYNIPIPWPNSLSSSEETADFAELASIGTNVQIVGLDLEQPGQRVVRPELDADSLELETAAPEPDAALMAQAAIVRAFGWISLHRMPILGAIWLGGALAAAVISVRRICRFQLVLREATPGSDQIQSWVDELSARLGVERPPQVWWLSGKLSPMLWALGTCPRLIIPIELWKGLDERQRAALLVHELAHLRRGDHRVRIFELVVTALYWWNPVLWWARQALRDVEEQCCDAWVVWAFPEAAKSYAETLLETLDFLNHSELSEPLLASGFGKVHHLRRRLTMIMSGTTPRLLGPRGALAALSLGALLLPVNPSWGQKPEEKKELRIVVKTEDGEDKVVKFGDVSDAPSTIVFADEPLQVLTDDVVAADPFKIGGGTVVYGANTFVVDGTGQSARKPGEKAQVTVVLTTDDSTVSISADSVEEALKKVTEQLKALKAKTAPGKNKYDEEALSQIVKQLEKIAKSAKSQKGAGASSGAGVGSGKGDSTGTRRVVVRRLEDIKTAKTMSPEKKAQIDKMRSKIKALSNELADTQRKLAQLEGSNIELKVVKVFPDGAPRVADPMHFEKLAKVIPDGAPRVADPMHVEKDVKIKVIPKKLEVEAKLSNLKEVRALTQKRIQDEAVKTFTRDEDRIQALEKKLNKVIEALDSLKKSKGD